MTRAQRRRVAETLHAIADAAERDDLDAAPIVVAYLRGVADGLTAA